MLRHAAGPAARQVCGTTLRIGEGVSGWVAAQRQVIVNSEASLDLGARAHAAIRLGHALSVPLIARESLVGTVTLYSPSAFSESQSRLVQVIAPHLAQAIWTSKQNDNGTRVQSQVRPLSQAPPSTCGWFRPVRDIPVHFTVRSHIPVPLSVCHFENLLKNSSQVRIFVDWRLPCSVILQNVGDCDRTVRAVAARAT